MFFSRTNIALFIGAMTWISIQYHAEASPIPSSQQLTLLKEAEDHLNVLPEKSLSILMESRGLQELSLENQVRWHFATLTAARKTAELSILESTLRHLLTRQENSYFIEHEATFLKNLGVWFRRSGFLHDAKLSYLCSIEHSPNMTLKLQSLLNLAVVERNQQNISEAKRLNKIALNYAAGIRNQTLIATIQNNLGIIALNENDLEGAVQFFRTALDINHKQMRRSGEILNGINLLSIFVRQGQFSLYERLYPRIDRMLSNYPNNARRAYLNWVHATYNKLNHTQPVVNSLDSLGADYENLNDDGIRKLLLPFAKILGVDVTPPEKQIYRHYKGDFLNRLPQCDWEKYQKMSYASMLDGIMQPNNG